MVDFFNEENWTSPRTLAMLGAGAGFLDPRGGMAAGMQGAMQGMRTGQQLQQERLLAQQQAEKLDRDMATKREFANIMAKYGKNPAEAHKALITSANPDLFGYAESLRKGMPTAKSFIKGLDEKGNPAFYTGMSTGEVVPTGITPAEKLMQTNEGGQIGLRNPYTGQLQSSIGVGMSPEAAAGLSQRASQFERSHGLDVQRTQNQIAQAKMPKLQDGYWIMPPSEANPQGSIIPTELSTAPKGSQLEKTKVAEKIKTTLGNDTEDLIKSATGSLLGAGRDLAASAVGITTDPAKANATLQMRAATLAGNMPRFEGPQSDADRAYYERMAGDLGNPTKTTTEKLMAFNELKRIHNLVESDGSIKKPITPGIGNVKNQGGVSGGWGGAAQGKNDGWGELR
jgi:hypothetical protein